MENKTPVKKVLFRKEDVFYIYDKRINKCVKEDCQGKCQGTVKYGLNLQVHMPNGDTLNTFECNKCHMKYSAYPNYVRLNDARHIYIYNYAEVRAKDKKRRDDARKQARLNHKKPFVFGRKQYSNNVTKIGGYKKRLESGYDYNDEKGIAADE
jgi:uncharacterized C2H2 Zn-finger protein